MKLKIPMLLAMLGCSSLCRAQVTPEMEPIPPVPITVTFPFLLYQSNPANSCLSEFTLLHLNFHRGFGGLHTYQLYVQKPLKSAHYLHAGLSRNGDTFLHTSRFQLGWAKKMGSTSLGLRTHYIQTNGPDIRGVSRVQVDFGSHTTLTPQLHLASFVSFTQINQNTLAYARIGLDYQPISVLQLTTDFEVSPIHIASQTTLFYRFHPQFIGGFGYYSRLYQFQFYLTQETSTRLHATICAYKGAQRPLQSQFSLTYLFL